MEKINSSTYSTTETEQKIVEDMIAEKYVLNTDLPLNSHLEERFIKTVVARETLIAFKSHIKLESGTFYQINTKYKGMSVKVSVGAIEPPHKPIEYTYGILEL